MSKRAGLGLETRALSERQARIVEAALRVIATRGSRRFTAQLLAREVGLTAGALYRHFAGLDEIVDAVVDRVGALLFQDFPPAAADPLERLRIFFYRRARTVLGDPYLSRLLLSDHLSQAAGAAQSKRLQEFKKISRAFVVECLREAGARGSLCDGLSPEAAAVVVLGSILALSQAMTRAADGAANDRLVDEVWSAIERMLRCAPAAAQPNP